MGGATEAAIWSNMHELVPDETLAPSWTSIPYGRPLRNQTMLVLDDNLEHCEPWVCAVTIPQPRDCHRPVCHRPPPHPPLPHTHTLFSPPRRHSRPLHSPERAKSQHTLCVQVTGVIHIGGAGVALGYYGDAEKTARQFLRPELGERGGCLFRTGDLGRLRPDGLLEILGREDSQVKVNGFRVELGEIEEVRIPRTPSDSF